MNIKVKQKPKHGENSHNTVYTDGRTGYFAVVKYVNPKSCTVDLIMDTGVFLNAVEVISNEWVYDHDGYVSGERNLPPVGARVFVFMPTGNIESSIVIGSALSVTEALHKKGFMDGSDDEQKKNAVTRKIVYPGNWKSEYNYTDASFSLVSPDEKTSISYSAENSEKKRIVVLKVFDEVSLTIEENKKADITIGGTTIIFSYDSTGKKGVKLSFDGDLAISATGNISIKSGAGKKVAINGTGLEVEASNE